LFRVVLQVGPGKGEERAPHPGGAPFRNPFQPLRPRPPQNPKKDRLGLVFPMMGHEEDSPAQSLLRLLEKSVAEAPGLPFVRGSPRGDPEMAREVPRRTHPPDPQGVRSTPLPHPMIEVGHGEATTNPGNLETKEVQEDQRVHPPGHRYTYRTLRRPPRTRGEVPAESSPQLQGTKPAQFPSKDPASSGSTP